jgi:hypothetical protein
VAEGLSAATGACATWPQALLGDDLGLSAFSPPSTTGHDGIDIPRPGCDVFYGDDKRAMSSRSDHQIIRSSDHQIIRSTGIAQFARMVRRFGTSRNDDASKCDLDYRVG